MSVPLGQSYSFWKYGLQDDLGNLITGATWDVSACSEPDAIEITEPDDPGDYFVAITPTIIGPWKIKAIPNGDAEIAVKGTLQVTDPATDAQTIADAVLAASVTGGAAYTVAGQLEALNDLVTSNVTVVNALSTSQALTVSPGTTYSGVTALTWSADWPVSLVGATVTFTAYANDQPQLSLVGSIAGSVISVALSSVQTAGFALTTPFYEWRYEVNAVLSGGAVEPLVAGEMTVRT